MDAIFIGEMLIDFTPGQQPASYIRLYRYGAQRLNNRVSRKARK